MSRLSNDGSLSQKTLSGLQSVKADSVVVGSVDVESSIINNQNAISAIQLDIANVEIDISNLQTKTQNMIGLTGSTSFTGNTSMANVAVSGVITGANTITLNSSGQDSTLLRFGLESGRDWVFEQSLSTAANAGLRLRNIISNKTFTIADHSKSTIAQFLGGGSSALNAVRLYANTSAANVAISKALSVSGDTSMANATFSGVLSGPTGTFGGVNIYGATGTTNIYLDGSNNLHLGGGGNTGTYFADAVDDCVCIIQPRTSGGGVAGLVSVNSTSVYAWEFDSVNSNEISFIVQLPHSWKEGSSVVPHLHWCPSTTNTSNVIFNMDYWVVNMGEAVPSISTTISKTVTPSGVAFQHGIASFGMVSMTGKRISCLFGGRVYRNPLATGDDFTGSALVLSVDLHIVKNRLGEWTGYA